MGGDETGPVHELFTLGRLILAEPKRPVLRRYHGPRMHVAAEDGTVLAHLHERGTFAYVLQDLAGRSVLGVDLVSKGVIARPRFRLTDGDGLPLGEARAPGRVNRTRRLDVRTGSGALRLTRTAVMGRTWLVHDQLDRAVGRVTVSTWRSMDGLQRYEVEPDPRTESEQRRLLVAATVCLQVIRRWSSAPYGTAA
ncbi:hypothetical protein [Streptomyces sp. NPDC026092]|uniref:hypothetical protein n=1 Tax=Streptomyces sp. NPDC026092 TaxID=3154797 RepID=UPI003400CC1E